MKGPLYTYSHASQSVEGMWYYNKSFIEDDVQNGKGLGSFFSCSCCCQEHQI